MGALAKLDNVLPEEQQAISRQAGGLHPQRAGAVVHGDHGEARSAGIRKQLGHVVMVTQVLVGALAAENVGKTVTRAMSVDGDSLTIVLATSSSDGQPVVRTLVWTRIG